MGLSFEERFGNVAFSLRGRLELYFSTERLRRGSPCAGGRGSALATAEAVPGRQLMVGESGLA